MGRGGHRKKETERTMTTATQEKNTRKKRISIRQRQFIAGGITFLLVASAFVFLGIQIERSTYQEKPPANEDGIVDGEKQGVDGVGFNAYTARRVEITRTIDGFKAHGDVTIEDCWIHDLDFRTGPGTGAGDFSHNDCTQVSSGSNITLRRNRCENTRGNSAHFVDADQGKISTVTIDSNYYNNTGNYMVYVKQSESAPQYGLPDKVTITNNLFGKRPDYLPADWGLMAAEVHATNLIWQNNIQQSSGKQLVLDQWGKANPA